MCQIAEHQRGLDARREIRIGLPVVRLSGLAVAMNQPSAKRQIADRWRHRGHTIEQVPPMNWTGKRKPSKSSPPVISAPLRIHSGGLRLSRRASISSLPDPLDRRGSDRIDLVGALSMANASSPLCLRCGHQQIQPRQRICDDPSLRRDALDDFTRCALIHHRGCLLGLTAFRSNTAASIAAASAPRGREPLFPSRGSLPPRPQSRFLQPCLSSVA